MFTYSADYIDAVVQELQSAPKDKVSTIFFGGGTPSLLPAKDLGRVISAIREHNGLFHDAEITLETLSFGALCNSCTTASM